MLNFVGIVFFVYIKLIYCAHVCDENPCPQKDDICLPIESSSRTQGYVDTLEFLVGAISERECQKPIPEEIWINDVILADNLICYLNFNDGYYVHEQLYNYTNSNGKTAFYNPPGWYSVVLNMPDGNKKIIKRPSICDSPNEDLETPLETKYGTFINLIKNNSDGALCFRNKIIYWYSVLNKPKSVVISGLKTITNYNRTVPMLVHIPKKTEAMPNIFECTKYSHSVCGMYHEGIEIVNQLLETNCTGTNINSDVTTGFCSIIREINSEPPPNSYCAYVGNYSYEYKCLKGFHYDGDGCVDVDECLENPLICDEGYSCVNNHGNYSCIDVDECSKLNNCDSNTTVCVNYVGTYKCNCIDHINFKTDPNDTHSCIPHKFEFRLLDPYHAQCVSTRSENSAFLVKARLSGIGNFRKYDYIEPIACLHLNDVDLTKVDQRTVVSKPYILHGDAELEAETLLQYVKLTNEAYNKKYIPKIMFNPTLIFDNGCRHYFINVLSLNTTTFDKNVFITMTEPTKEYFNPNYQLRGIKFKKLPINTELLSKMIGPNLPSKIDIKCLRKNNAHTIVFATEIIQLYAIVVKYIITQ